MPDFPESPFAVALRLAEHIAAQEGKVLGYFNGASETGATREYAIKLYSECLAAVGSQNMKFTPR